MSQLCALSSYLRWTCWDGALCYFNAALNHVYYKSKQGFSPSSFKKSVRQLLVLEDDMNKNRCSKTVLDYS